MNRKAFILAMITIIGWASGFAGVSASLQGGFSPGNLILYRLLVASLLFLLYAILPSSRIRLPHKKDLPLIITLGIVGITFYHVGVTFGQQYINAGTTSMIVGSAPIFTTIIAVLFLKEKMEWYSWVGLFVGFIGVSLITIGTGDFSFTFSKGILPALFATICTSIFFVYQKPLLQKYDPIELTAYFTWAATIPLFILFPSLIENLQTTTLEANLAVLYVGAIPAAACYAMWAIATSLGEISKLSTLLYLETPIAIIVAWIWLGELPTVLSMIGGFITIASVAVVNFIASRKNQQKGAT